MELYRTMQSSFEQQKRFLHDYKNQLGCVQGLLADGKTEEAGSYIAGLSEAFKSGDYVNTNHPAVNVVLNRKYADALEKKITITMSVNDLSGLTMKEEEIVTLLVNLLDNAMEACEKLDEQDYPAENDSGGRWTHPFRQKSFCRDVKKKGKYLRPPPQRRRVPATESAC